MQTDKPAVEAWGSLMRALLGLAAAICLVASLARAQHGTDSAAQVRAAFEQYDQAWRTYDAGKVVAAFSSDFEWTNEVGLRFADKAELRRFLDRTFQDPSFRAGKTGPLVIRSIRVLAPDIAVVSSSEDTIGQIDKATGKAVPALRTNELTVMQRRRGRWLIVRDLTSDESHGI